MTTRKSDMKLERVCAQWMDRHFWNSWRSSFERLDDLDHQLKGIDLRLYNENASVYFDEKFKLKRTLNKPLNAVGFEMSLVLNGEPREGWFGGDWAQADMYATVCLSATVEDHTELKDAAQITAADVLWTSKKELKKWVESFGVTVKDLLGMSDCMREAYDMGYMETRKKFQHGAFWLTLSTSMDEMPVNLVVPWTRLEKLPKTRRFLVTDKGIERII